MPDTTAGGAANTFAPTAANGGLPTGTFPTTPGAFPTTPGAFPANGGYRPPTAANGGLTGAIGTNTCGPTGVGACTGTNMMPGGATANLPSTVNFGVGPACVRDTAKKVASNREGFEKSLHSLYKLYDTAKT